MLFEQRFAMENHSKTNLNARKSKPQLQLARHNLFQHEVLVATLLDLL